MRKNLTQEQIFNAANKIAAEGRIPTLTKVQLALGKGSKVTVHKYFKQWQQTLVKKFSDLNATAENSGDSLGNKDSAHLKLELHKLLKRNEDYTQELINAEKLNLELNKKNQELQIATDKLQLEVTAAKDWRFNIESIIDQIKHELNFNANASVKQMQQTIDDLRKELKTLNEKSLDAIRDTSSQGHDLLMQEKVNSINLQAKVDDLTKELLASKKELDDVIISSKVQIKTLLRENEDLLAILQEHLGEENLSQLKKLRLVANQEVKAYAK